MPLFTYQLEREFLRRSILKHAHLLTGSCLDVGAGGKESRYRGSLHNVSDYTSLEVGLEFSPDLVGTAESIPAPEKSFDSILCTQTLCNVEDPQRALVEFHRVLTKGGSALITVPLINLYRGEHDLWRFTPSGLCLLLEKAGFEILLSENVGVGIFSILHQFCNRFIKIKLGMNRRNIPRKIFNKLSLFSGNICMWLDKKITAPENQKFIMNVLVVARKPLV